MPEAAAPVTVVIGALGGEGGGVLAGWLVDAAQAEGLWVQTTSVPGVAQRTGATTYYLEISPQPRDDAEPPVMALLPSPGNVDLLVASELLEAGRAAQNGMVTPERTTVIASTHRLYAIAEKSAMGDGRFDTDRIVHTVRQMARAHVLGDLGQLAAEAGAVINAVLYGAMAATGVLPLSREALEGAVRRGGIAVEANLAGFAAGYDYASKTLSGAAAGGAPPAADSPASAAVDDRLAALPATVRELAALGVERTYDYQGRHYAELYLERIAVSLAAERGLGRPGEGYGLTREVARHLALWMAYEDVIRVADLKTRAERYERVRREVRARPEQPVVITEFLKPGVDEWCDVLPGFLARPLLGLAERSGLRRHLNFGLHLKTTSVSGFLALWLLARLRWRRPYSWRYAREQRLIEGWLERIGAAAALDYDFALELAQCAHLLKGYGDTHARGLDNFNAIMGRLDACAETSSPAAALRALREAALADPEGATLARALDGLVPAR